MRRKMKKELIFINRSKRKKRTIPNGIGMVCGAIRKGGAIRKAGLYPLLVKI